MSTVIQQLYSRTMFAVDGSTTVWNFTFTGGYIDKAHIEAYQVSSTNQAERIPLNLETQLIGPFQLLIEPALPAGTRLLIMRNTPKDLPIVNFQDRGRVTEQSLDTNALQAVFIAAEAADAVLAGLTAGFVDNELGYKSLLKIPYTGASFVQIVDNGRSHYKTDGTSVNVPNSLRVDFLSTILNDSDLGMTVTFEGGARMQGVSDTTPAAVWLLQPRSMLHITKISDAMWWISGNAVRV